MDLKELKQHTADKLKWDRATLQQKIGELMDLVEALREAGQDSVEIPSDELRVVANEITRRTAMLDIAKERHPEDKHRIDIALCIGEDWVGKILMTLKHRRRRADSTTRYIIKEGFKFLPEHLRATMLKEYDKGVEEVAVKND